MLDRVLLGGNASSALRPVRVASAVDEVSDRLLTAIAVGDFLPGERLPAERELTTLLHVSRPTVREAVGRLQALGVIEIRRGRNGGAFVRGSWSESSGAAVRRTLLPRWEEFEQLFDLRGLVEGMVAATAARRRRPEDLEPMREALDAHLAARTPARSRPPTAPSIRRSARPPTIRRSPCSAGTCSPGSASASRSNPGARASGPTTTGPARGTRPCTRPLRPGSRSGRRRSPASTS